MRVCQKALPVRVSEGLRALLDQAGPITGATRALLILGAHAVGYDVTALRHEIAGLLLRGELDAAVLDALAHLAGVSSTSNSQGDSQGDSQGGSQGGSQGDSQGGSQGGSQGDSQGDSQGAISFTDPSDALDPFAEIGIAV